MVAVNLGICGALFDLNEFKLKLLLAGLQSLLEHVSHEVLHADHYLGRFLRLD